MSVLYTPQGGTIETNRPEVRLPPEFVKMLLVFADAAGMLDLGLHCSRCKTDLRGANGTRASLLRMECACRTFKGGNPLPPSPEGTVQ